MSAFCIRDARMPDDKQAALEFIMGMQKFEKAIEPDRRVDASVAAEFFEVIIKRVKDKNGHIFIAEWETKSIGWAVVYPDENDIFVEAAKRAFAYISELFVVEEKRGTGVGRALIAACEDWARTRGLTVMMLGVLSGNTRAAKIYEDAGYLPYATQRRKYL